MPDGLGMNLVMYYRGEIKVKDKQKKGENLGWCPFPNLVENPAILPVVTACQRVVICLERQKERVNNTSPAQSGTEGIHV